ncbi:MOSC domain-containing protein [Hymenobacter latericus]|uniref:MOSC domain-containing protein n=1 Tax=Hymenobacter sp. YIM 151858-1 TaxID=2987688 RepID=UPI002225C9B6|nr:MOSC N-terminal beta barrel domain-containing protein [Hymenobacter sp. YIM 151858-1]UYZ61025.1 MOSC domain-containing protein [Hymenobacter sp. YIM 151858-1]
MADTRAPLTLSDLYLYPVKSLGGFRVPEAAIEPRGLRHDRRWLLVDERGQFLTQRSQPTMALLHLEYAHNGFIVRHIQRPELKPLLVPFEAEHKGTQFVTVWDDMVFAFRGLREHDEWFSEALGQPCRLVHMPEAALRTADGGEARGLVSFADAYPFLLIGQASLDDLNRRLAEPVLMNRFRPNLVVHGAEAYAEDAWGSFAIGGNAFEGVRTCGRCVLITTDQQTAERTPEPLRTLAQYRTVGKHVMFGLNVVGPETGRLRVGDTVEVLGYRN